MEKLALYWKLHFVGNGANEIKTLPYGMTSDTIFYQTVNLLKRPARETSWYGYWNSLKKN